MSTHPHFGSLWLSVTHAHWSIDPIFLQNLKAYLYWHCPVLMKFRPCQQGALFHCVCDLVWDTLCIDQLMLERLETQRFPYKYLKHLMCCGWLGPSQEDMGGRTTRGSRTDHSRAEVAGGTHPMQSYRGPWAAHGASDTPARGKGSCVGSCKESWE